MQCEDKARKPSKDVKSILLSEVKEQCGKSQWKVKVHECAKAITSCNKEFNWKWKQFRSSSWFDKQLQRFDWFQVEFT